MLNAELRSDEDPRVSSARMLQLRPGQCATGHDGGVGGQPRRIAASAPIAAPHRCVSPRPSALEVNVEVMVHL